jgi:hypothetical protein
MALYQSPLPQEIDMHFNRAKDFEISELMGIGKSTALKRRVWKVITLYWR